MNQIQILLAFYLDKLKISNPILYLVSQGAVLLLLYLFTADKININETVDTGIIFILGGLVTGLSPRTSKRATEYKERTDDSFPNVDQSNN